MLRGALASMIRRHRLIHGARSQILVLIWHETTICKHPLLLLLRVAVSVMLLRCLREMTVSHECLRWHCRLGHLIMVCLDDVIEV